MNRRVLIFGVCFIQSYRAAMVLADPAALGVTSLNAQAVVFGNRFVLAAFMLCAVGLALWRELSSGAKTRGSTLWFFPQFSLTVIAAIGALACAALGHYADGVPRPFAFISADQVSYPVIAIWYFFAVFR